MKQLRGVANLFDCVGRLAVLGLVGAWSSLPARGESATSPDQRSISSSHTTGQSTLRAAAPAPRRLKRSEAFLGIHFDFHAKATDTNIGARTTPQMVAAILDKVQPDYVQVDCKGHPGYSSYPTRVGNPAPGIVGDPLRVWREVTAQRGVALYVHYSGVVDRHAAAARPEWAAYNVDGKPNPKAMSVFGPYVDQLLIPQLRELAGEYGVDGAWVDGDCWAVVLDYGDDVVRRFCAHTGAERAPRRPEDPFWQEWKEFNREGYRVYLRRYVDALRSSHPDFEVISNWAFSDHMPEPVSAGVAALSGDFAPDDSVNSARFTGRCFENQGMPWDLMSWGFSRKTWRAKPAVQLMQEAAVVLSLGGGYQAYFTQERDGAVRMEKLDPMAEVARFCRARQVWSHRSEAISQIALLYSCVGHYYESSRLFHPSGSVGIGILRSALRTLLGARWGVQVVHEHHVQGKFDRWPLWIVPGWTYLEPRFPAELGDYIRRGGAIVLVGEGPARQFEEEIRSAAARCRVVSASNTTELVEAVRQLFPNPIVTVDGPGNVDVSPRRLQGRLLIHLVNTGGPHEHPPPQGITHIPPAGPLTVTIRCSRAPKSITAQPEGQRLEVTWSEGVARVVLPRLELHTILVVEE